MTYSPSFRLFAAALALTALPALAQQAPSPAIPQPSPKARVEQQVGVSEFSVEYFSPGVKGRKIWGALVPFDQVWRTGANTVTRLTATRDFTIGGKPVPAGTYGLHTLPGKAAWTVILNSDANAWGSYSYDAAKDVVRVQVKPQPQPTSRERLTFIFSDTTDDSTQLDLEWEKLRIRVPLGVDTRGQVLAGIEKTLEDAWRPHFASARWLLESGGDLGQALQYVETSIAIKPTWWNHWVKAQIQAKTGKKQEALQTVQRTQELGKGDNVYERFYAPQIADAVRGWK